MKKEDLHIGDIIVIKSVAEVDQEENGTDDIAGYKAVVTALYDDRLYVDILDREVFPYDPVGWWIWYDQAYIEYFFEDIKVGELSILGI